MNNGKAVFMIYGSNGKNQYWIRSKYSQQTIGMLKTLTNTMLDANTDIGGFMMNDPKLKEKMYQIAINLEAYSKDLAEIFQNGEEVTFPNERKYVEDWNHTKDLEIILGKSPTVYSARYNLLSDFLDYFGDCMKTTKERANVIRNGKEL